MKKKSTTISTSQLRELLEQPGIVIVDARPVEAYNGWRLMNEPRGGHIRGARSLPCRWTRYMDWIEIVRGKAIYPENKIIIYGYDKKQSEFVAERFEIAGYKSVSIYEHFLDEWSPNTELPMDHLSRYRHLVSANWLDDLIHHHGNASEYDGKSFIILHAHYRNHQDYLRGHIPGAISLDTVLLESPVNWNRRTPDELQFVLQDLGITKDTMVILCGRFSFPDSHDPFPGSSEGQLAAMRCAFILMYAGVEDVRILNGGVTAWEEAGLKLSTAVTNPIPVLYFKTEIPVHPEYAVDSPQAKEMLVSDDADLVCVRSSDEYLGRIGGYNYIDKKGRIPGAVFANSGSDAYHTEQYRNPDNTCREYHEIASAWEQAGVDPSKHLAFYCGTGWRGSEAFFNAWLMGYPRISVYDGGWLEWSNDPLNPIESEIGKLNEQHLNIYIHADDNS